MDYSDVFYRRINHLGNTTAERIRNGGIRSFEKWMAQSPHTVRGLSVERGIFFDGIIIQNKDKEYSKIMLLHVLNTTNVVVGDIMNWHLEDGTTEKWIVLQEEKKVNPKYRTFWIIRCNYLLKWIDEKGHLQSSWAYVVSSVDSKIKGNYRTWNSLITPQPNKYAEILMPRRKITRATNFIVEDESWQVIEYDHTSVPGTIYLSLTENKINMIYDDTVNNIADTDKRAEYKIITPPPDSEQVFPIGPISGIPNFVITKNGVPMEITASNVSFISMDKQVIRVEKDGSLTAVGAGVVDLKVILLDCDDIEPDELYVKVRVGDITPPFDCYIKGSNKIRVGGDKETYQLIDVDGNVIDAIYSFENIDNVDEPLAYLVEYTTIEEGYSLNEQSKVVGYDKVSKKYEIETTLNNEPTSTATLRSNYTKGLIGEGKIIATVSGKTFEKTINIIPLW